MAVNRRNPRGLPRGFQLDNFNSQLENLVALQTVVICIIDDSQNVTVGAVVILLQNDPSICIVLTSSGGLFSQRNLIQRRTFHTFLLVVVDCDVYAILVHRIGVAAAVKLNSYIAFLNLLNTGDCNSHGLGILSCLNIDEISTVIGVDKDITSRLRGAVAAIILQGYVLRTSPSLVYGGLIVVLAVGALVRIRGHICILVVRASTVVLKLNNGTYSKDLPTAQDAGDYTVYYKVVGDDDHENTEERSFTVTIRKAAVTITARDKSAYVGGTVPVLPVEPVKDTDYTISEMYGTDTLEGNVTLTYDGTPDMSKAGSTVIKISGTLANDNYTITYVNGKLTVNRRSSGGGSSSSNSSANAISTSGKSDNGSISTDKPTAKKGDTVTIIVTPESGYKLDKLTVTDSKGNTLTVTDKGDGKYTFTMPDSKVTVIPTFAKETEVNPFTDVSTDAYYYKAVKWAQEKEITGGIGNDLFGPDAACTRAQIVTFLWRAAGSPEPKSMSSFSDVPADSYYAKAVAWAVENGITTGTGDGKFSPEATCTRAQSVTFLCRAVGKPFEGEVVFSDVPADSYYANAVAWAVKNKVTNGVAEGLFGPDNSCTRAQIVTFLYRTYQG